MPIGDIPLHSITLSSRASSACDTAGPIDLAALRLITSSNLVGCSIGRSPGFAPRKIVRDIGGSTETVPAYSARKTSGRPLPHTLGSLNPLDPRRYVTWTAMAYAYFLSGQHEHASRLAGLATQQQPNYHAAFRIMMVCHAVSGRLEEAREACSVAMQIDPTLRVSRNKASAPFRAPDLQKLRERLIALPACRNSREDEDEVRLRVSPLVALSGQLGQPDDVRSLGQSIPPQGRATSVFDPLRTYRNQNRPKRPRREALRLNYGSPFVNVKGLNPHSARAAHEAAPRCGNRK